MKPRIGWRAVARFFAGESSAEEAAEINAWARNDPQHAELLETSRRAWDAAEPGTREWNVDVAWHNVAEKMQAPIAIPIDYARSKRSRAWLIPAIAAAVVLLIAGPWMYSSLTRFSKDATFTTAAGEQRMIRLVDGSVARLAENSSLRFNRRLPRQVWLEGKVFLAVAERAVPFVVHTPAGEARVLGTRFELHADATTMRLAVLEGRVALLTEAGAEQVVSAGQVSASEKGAPPSAPRPADVQSLINWMGRVLIFQDTPLLQAIQEVERLYGVEARITDNSLKDRTVSATFENESLSTVVTTLCRVVDAKCDVQDKSIRISQ